MGKIDTIKRLWRRDKYQLLVAAYDHLCHTHITDLLSDEAFLKLTFRIKIREKLDLQHPVTFNQKLQWLKLYDRQERYITMVDKVLVKDYVSGIIGADYIIPKAFEPGVGAAIAAAVAEAARKSGVARL